MRTCNAAFRNFYHKYWFYLEISLWYNSSLPQFFWSTTEGLFLEFPKQRDKILEKHQEMCFTLAQNTTKRLLTTIPNVYVPNFTADKHELLFTYLEPLCHSFMFHFSCIVWSHKVTILVHSKQRGFYIIYKNDHLSFLVLFHILFSIWKSQLSPEEEVIAKAAVICR